MIPPDHVLLGTVGRAHGVRGLVRVHSHAADPATLAALPLVDDRGGQWRLAWRGDGVAELRDPAGRALPDRTAAERLTNRPLFVPRAALPAPDEDEFYLADLVGLRAVDVAGAPLGTVAAVHDYGAGASLEIARVQGAPLLLLPFNRACVPGVDVAGGVVTVALPDEVEARE